MSTSKLPETTMCQRCPENVPPSLKDGGQVGEGPSTLFVTAAPDVQDEAEAASVAMIDDPP